MVKSKKWIQSMRYLILLLTIGDLLLFFLNIFNVTDLWFFKDFFSKN